MSEPEEKQRKMKRLIADGFYFKDGHRNSAVQIIVDMGETVLGVQFVDGLTLDSYPKIWCKSMHHWDGPHPKSGYLNEISRRMQRPSSPKVYRQ